MPHHGEVQPHRSPPPPHAPGFFIVTGEGVIVELCPNIPRRVVREGISFEQGGHGGVVSKQTAPETSETTPTPPGRPNTQHHTTDPSRAVWGSSCPGARPLL